MLFKTNTTPLIHIQKKERKKTKKGKKKSCKILKMDQDNMREPQSIYFLFILHFKDLICINLKGNPKWRPMMGLINNNKN